MDLPCFSANLRRASRAVGRLYGSELRKSGLETTQFTLLAALARLDEAMQGELAQRLAIDSTTLTRTLGRLEEQGWVATRPGEDRRERWIRLTARGRRRYEAALPHWQAAQERLRKALGEENWSPILERLVEVTRAAEAA
ncbi:MAG TPA: MarR family transcriptional regulator [Gemmatimonadota bacterium]|nr:MarR family transcriptional regulator [Gemmatimonadota bacterium]